jgi:hypothetical protein
MKLRNMLLMAAVFLIGALASSIGGLWHPYVTVTVKNVSHQPLSEIEMKIQNPKKEILSLLATLTILITSNICTKVLYKVLEKASLLHWEDLS